MTPDNKKIIITFIGVIILGLLLFFGASKNKHATQESLIEESSKESSKIELSSSTISETNFKGTKLTIKGSSELARAANAFLTDSYNDFKAEADKDVPDLKKEFGKDVGAAHYELTQVGEIIESNYTSTVVITEGKYTGGANGMTTLRTFTSDNKTGALISLKNVLKDSSNETLLNLVKSSLKEMKGEDGVNILDNSLIDQLTFTSLRNWSANNDVMTFYFDKYEVGTGYIGPVEVAIPLSSVRSAVNIIRNI